MVAVDGWPGYMVTPEGRVWSVPRTYHAVRKGTPCETRTGGRWLKVDINSRGYARVRLANAGHSKLVLVHRLVALAYLKQEAGKCEVNHIDGNKLNNSRSNLEWVTPSGNVLHSWARRKEKAND